MINPVDPLVVPCLWVKRAVILYTACSIYFWAVFNYYFFIFGITYWAYLTNFSSIDFFLFLPLFLIANLASSVLFCYSINAFILLPYLCSFLSSFSKFLRLSDTWYIKFIDIYIFLSWFAAFFYYFTVFYRFCDFSFDSELFVLFKFEDLPVYMDFYLLIFIFFYWSFLNFLFSA